MYDVRLDVGVDCSVLQSILTFSEVAPTTRLIWLYLKSLGITSLNEYVDGLSKHALAVEFSLSRSTLERALLQIKRFEKMDTYSFAKASLYCSYALNQDKASKKKRMTQKSSTKD